jgi:spore coat polysaccharide biosynthesis predicted glycosyltransferase SpsG
MGGVDKENRTPGVLSAIGHFELSVTAVIGPGFKNQEEIRKVAADLSCPIKLQEDPDNLAKLFLNADLAVCTLGTTAYELLSAQTPIIGIPDNETPIDQALAARNAAVVLSRNPTSNEIRNAVDRVMSDKELRRSLWRAGDQIVSGDGAKKIIGAIEKTMGDQL